MECSHSLELIEAGAQAAAAVARKRGGMVAWSLEQQQDVLLSFLAVEATCPAPL